MNFWFDLKYYHLINIRIWFDFWNLTFSLFWTIIIIIINIINFFDWSLNGNLLMIFWPVLGARCLSLSHLCRGPWVLIPAGFSRSLAVGLGSLENCIDPPVCVGCVSVCRVCQCVIVRVCNQHTPIRRTITTWTTGMYLVSVSVSCHFSVILLTRVEKVVVVRLGWWKM